MPIRWDEFPHIEIRLKIHARLDDNAAVRSAEDSLRHVLQRRLSTLNAEDHRRFIELEAATLVERLRCTRDGYQDFVKEHNCQPTLEAQWVVLRCAVFPTAVAHLRECVIRYAKRTRIPGRDISMLFGIPTRTCYKEFGHGFGFLCPPDPNDPTPASDAELQSLGNLADDNLLWFRDIRDGGAVGRPCGGGPFAIDDARSIRSSWSLSASRQQIALIDWIGVRKKLWHMCSPWTDGLVSLFGCVQEELLSQWEALPMDSLRSEHDLIERRLKELKEIVVPVETRLPRRLDRGKQCEELANELATIKHKRGVSGLTMAEIEAECSVFKIWKRVDVLSAEDREAFMHPGTWEPGYSHRLLGKLFANNRRNIAPGTVNTWRKEYRAYLRWQEKNPSRTADDFGVELRRQKRAYRNSPPTK